MCPHTAVSSYYYMCPHITIYASSYYYICPHTTIYVSSHSYICVLKPGQFYRIPKHYSSEYVLLYMCPQTATYVSTCYCMCPHTCRRSRTASSNFFSASSYYICVHILLYMRPHTCRRSRTASSKFLSSMCAAARMLSASAPAQL